MTSTALTRRGSDGAPGWDHPVEPARLPAEAAMHKALAKIRAWTPYDGDAVLDDVADALDTIATPEDRVEALGLRLRSHLMHLVGTALNYVAEEKDQPEPRIKQARYLREQEIPGDYQQALGHLRRMGWAVNELLDLLVEHEIMKMPDSLKDGSLPVFAEAQPLAAPGTKTGPAAASASIVVLDQTQRGRP
ncbi:DUF6415 family natural product biosynthesis protein [Streptomyces sp. NPDC052101]|uniref:DUF6415 family natural product biosynthesis protein n=1 Tax=Streptomyces sp. NPDC052101 TaxID=3155763 RepID=UPI00344A9EE3